MIINNYHIISDAVVIAFATYFIYLVIFAYESAYARILGISPNLITLSLTDIFDKIIPLFCSLFIASLIFLLFMNTKDVAIRISYFLKFVIPIIFFFVYFFSTKANSVLTLKRVMIFIAVIFFLFVVESLKNENGNLLVPLINIKLNINIFWFLLIALMTSYATGIIMTSTMESYSVLKIEKEGRPPIEKVILRIYGDKIIVADVEKIDNKKTVINYSLYKLPILENHTIYLDKTIGCLSAKK